MGLRGARPGARLVVLQVARQVARQAARARLGLDRATASRDLTSLSLAARAMASLASRRLVALAMARASRLVMTMVLRQEMLRALVKLAARLRLELVARAVFLALLERERELVRMDRSVLGDKLQARLVLEARLVEKDKEVRELVDRSVLVAISSFHRS